MIRHHISRLFAACALLLGCPAQGGTADFTGTLTTFVGLGRGLPTSARPIQGSATGVFFGSGASAFTVPSGVFTTRRTTPVGFTPNSPPSNFRLYTIRTITNASNAAGSFSGSPGTGPTAAS